MQPVLVDKVTSTSHSSEQHWLLWVSSTGSRADQYWSTSPLRKAHATYLAQSPQQSLPQTSETELKAWQFGSIQILLYLCGAFQL